MAAQVTVGRRSGGSRGRDRPPPPPPQVLYPLFLSLCLTHPHTHVYTYSNTHTTTTTHTLARSLSHTNTKTRPLLNSRDPKAPTRLGARAPPPALPRDQRIAIAQKARENGGGGEGGRGLPLPGGEGFRDRLEVTIITLALRICSRYRSWKVAP